MKSAQARRGLTQAERETEKVSAVRLLGVILLIVAAIMAFGAVVANSVGTAQALVAEWSLISAALALGVAVFGIFLTTTSRF